MAVLMKLYAMQELKFDTIWFGTSLRKRMIALTLFDLVQEARAALPPKFARFIDER